MTKVYREGDADPSILSERKIAVIGYGNQGRAQALNLRDSGASVVIGNIDDAYQEVAKGDQFEVMPIAEAVAESDVILMLLPDEIAPAVFAAEVAPNLERHSVLCFASGYTITYELIKPPADVDVILLAPRMIGAGVRDLFVEREGFFSFVAVHQNASGLAREVLLGLALGIGTLWKGAVEVTFRMETELDLFNEQAFGPAFGRVLLTAINTLIEAGYPKEAVLLEFYMSGELGYICRQMSETGLIKQLDCHSQTSQYGAISRGVEFLRVNLARPMKKILKKITSGKFAPRMDLGTADRQVALSLPARHGPAPTDQPVGTIGSRRVGAERMTTGSGQGSVQELACAREMVGRARQAAEWWAGQSVRQRARWLLRYRDLLLDRLEEITSVVGREINKPRLDVVSEVFQCCSLIGYFARQAPRLLRPRRVSPMPLINKSARICYRPLGVVGIITPWNYPVVLMLSPVIQALLAGNTVIVKPSEHATASARLLHEIFEQLAPPEPILQLLTGGPASAVALAGSGVDKISFTGGTCAGRVIAEVAGRNLTPVLLELGGNDAMLVAG